jgi:hypothetical protein
LGRMCRLNLTEYIVRFILAALMVASFSVQARCPNCKDSEAGQSIKECPTGKTLSAELGACVASGAAASAGARVADAGAKLVAKSASPAAQKDVKGKEEDLTKKGCHSHGASSEKDGETSRVKCKDCE